MNLRASFSLLGMLTGLGVLAAGLLSSCSSTEERFTAERPFAVRIAQVRNYYEAEAVRDRAKDMGLDPYLVAREGQDLSKWYEVLLGAEADYEAIMQEKFRYEDEYKITGVEVVNFNKMYQELVLINPAKIQPELLAEAEPEWPATTEAVLRQFPVLEALQPAQVLYYAPPVGGQEAALRRRIATPDLPRGIGLSSLFPQAQVLTEVVYRAPLFSQQFTLDIVRFRQGYQKTEADSIARYWAHKIIATRDYEQEAMQSVSVSASTQLSGFHVLISPRPGQQRNYLVLTDPEQQMAYFLQSADYQQESLLNFAESIGNHKRGLLAYPRAYNSLCALPEMPDAHGDWWYSFVKPDQDGYLASEAAFADAELGLWRVQSTHFYEVWRAEAAFSTMLTSRYASQQEELRLRVGKGLLRARGGSVRLFVQAGAILSSVQGLPGSQFSAQDLQTRAEALRFGE